MELDKSIERLKEKVKCLEKHIEIYEKYDCKTAVYKELIEEKQDLETVLKALENSISKDKIKEKIKKYKEMADDFYIKFLESDKLDLEIRDAGFSCDMKAEALQELLEGK